MTPSISNTSRGPGDIVLVRGFAAPSVGAVLVPVPMDKRRFRQFDWWNNRVHFWRQGRL